ncbi:MAG TPA: glycosyltransferase family 39 protein, partial [Thermoanaerobaculia bacterium]|nr:glycosyltransferase family 39 protein [Thermoanaerobaculia bacterium]
MSLRPPGTAPGGLLLLLALGLLVLGAGLGAKEPWPADAPRFTLVAREMVAGGDWLFPRRGGELYSDKPPVFLWLQAAALAATGSTRLAHQLPSLLAALGCLALVADLGRRLWGERAGFWSGVALLAIVQFPLQARSGQIDATLAFFTTLAFYGLLRHLLLGPAWGWYAAAFAAMGVGVLTKGVGILPLLLLVPWAWGRNRGWTGLPRFSGGWRWATGPAMLLAVIAAWAVPMSLAAAGSPELTAYRDDILLRQTVVRYAKAWAHARPPWYYLVEVIPLLWFPATALLPWLVPAWRRQLRDRDGRILVLLAWVVLVVGFFSLSRGKRDVYLLPAVPAVALAAGLHLPALWRARSAQRTAFGLTLLLALLPAVAALAVLLGRVPASAAQAIGDPRGLLAPLGAATLLAAGALLVRPARGLLALGLALASLWLLVGWWVAPRIDPYRSGTHLMARVAAALPAGGELAMVRWR